MKDQLSKFWAAFCFAGLMSVCIMSMANSCQTVKEGADSEENAAASKNTEAQIVSFSLSGRNTEFECRINQETLVIEALYDNDEDLHAMTAARAEYTLSKGASISPDPAEPLDYTVDGGRKLTVTSEDGKSKNDYVAIPTKREAPIVKAKPVALWIDAEANFGRLATKASIKSILEKAHQTGFNSIIVDIKPVQGDVLYDSEFLPKCTSLGGTTVENRDYDYMQYFIDEARAMNMRVTVSTTIMTMGLPQSKTGPAYTDSWWDDKMCVEYLPTGFSDIRNNPNWDTFAFVNPVHPEVRSYIKRLVQEVASKYDVDGYALDYCRYMNMNSDFSDLSRTEFEKWLASNYPSKKLENWPTDIYSYTSPDVDRGAYNAGPLFSQWIEWRASVIRDVVADIRGWVKEVRPNCDIEYWAASWWPLPHTGQNWASPNKNPVSEYGYWSWALGSDYYKTGFADQLDIFQLGAYLDKVYGKYNNESIEYAINRAKKVIGDDCKLYGTFQCATSSFDVASAVELSLKETDGCMVFELSHIIRNNKWNEIKKGIDQAWKDLGVNDLEHIDI